MYEDVERTPLPDALRRALGKPWAAHIGVKVRVLIKHSCRVHSTSNLLLWV